MAVLNFLDRVQESSGGSKKFWTDPRSVAALGKVFGRIQKASGRRKRFWADLGRLEPSKKILARCRKSGPVPGRIFRCGNVERRQISSPAALFFAGLPEEAERCGEAPRQKNLRQRCREALDLRGAAQPGQQKRGVEGDERSAAPRGPSDPIVRPNGPAEFSPGLSAAMPWERRSSPQSAL